MLDKKLCERCQRLPANCGERYCSHCRKDVLQKMADAGYLRPVPQSYSGQGRSNDHRENTYDTKYGR